MRRTAVLALLLAACSSAVQPTPRIIYVTPGPAAQPTPEIVYVTPGPVASPASTAPAAVTAEPRPADGPTTAPVRSAPPTAAANAATPATPTPDASPYARQGEGYLLRGGRGDDLAVYVIQEVHNEGQTWIELETFDSSWTIRHAAGGRSETGPFTFAFPMYLAPGQTGYLAEEVRTQVDEDELAGLAVDAHYAEVSEPDVKFSASDVRIRLAGSGAWVASGRVANGSSEDVDQVQVGIVLLDSQGVPLAIGSAYVGNIGPGQTKAFRTRGSMAAIGWDDVEPRVFVNHWDF